MPPPACRLKRINAAASNGVNAVCMHKHKYTYISCIHKHIHAHTHAHTYTRMHVRTHARTHARTHTRTLTVSVPGIPAQSNSHRKEQLPSEAFEAVVVVCVLQECTDGGQVAD